MMYGDETLWRRLMGKLVDVLGSFAIIAGGGGRPRYSGIR